MIILAVAKTPSGYNKGLEISICVGVDEQNSCFIRNYRVYTFIAYMPRVLKSLILFTISHEFQTRANNFKIIIIY